MSLSSATKPAVLAIGAHPDDIELMMAGTLLLLAEAGYALHVMNVADGCCGSMTEDAESTARRRLAESRAAAEVMGATHHPSIAKDLEIFYEGGLLRQLAAVMREVAPTIVLTHPPVDYMEDHTATCRLAVTAAFVRGMPNFQTEPARPVVSGSVTVYHALPWGLHGPLNERVEASAYVDIGRTLAKKREALACHASQKEWLDQTQGLDSYLTAMEDATRDVGLMSGKFELAEGWRRHSHLGFCAPNADPLRDALGENIAVKPEED